MDSSDLLNSVSAIESHGAQLVMSQSSDVGWAGRLAGGLTSNYRHLLRFQSRLTSVEYRYDVDVEVKVEVLYPRRTVAGASCDMQLQPSADASRVTSTPSSQSSRITACKAAHVPVHGRIFNVLRSDWIVSKLCACLSYAANGPTAVFILPKRGTVKYLMPVYIAPSQQD